MSTSDPDPIDIKQLGYIWNPQLEPLFQQEGRDAVKSAWYGHVPFAHWVIDACKPRTLVELGTGMGVSYSAFCEAVMRTGLKTRCFAVDTWQGDAHAGEYGEEVYLDFRRFHDDRYGTFSELLRTTFDAAVHLFQDGCV